MRMYITTAIAIIAGLAIYIGFQQGLFQNDKIPYDTEQEGLSEQIMIHFSHVVAEDTPKGQAAMKFAQLVAERSHNKIRVEISPNALLYNDETELAAVKDNKVQMIAPSFSKMTKEVPAWEVLDLPYLFHTTVEVQKVFTGEMADDLLAELNNTQIKALGFWQNGFKQILSEQKQIIQVNDFHGLKVRAMPSDVLTKQFQTVQAIPINSSFDELFTDMNNKKMDAMENTISNIYSKRFYDREKYLTLSDHGILAYSVIINQSFWQSLSPADQSIIQEALAETTKWNFKNAQKMNSLDLEKLESNDLPIYHLSNKEKERWAKAFQPVYKYIASRPAQTYLTKIQSVLQQKNIQ
ncbi:C4-dicarboxylate-binding periplasmic protein precursor [Kurthia zopfii]|nr:C4-dicarboxylate-binding periplasmic protein precursor [Kurthia zopfii]